MAAQLGATLSRSYLGSKYYTIPQIRVAFETLKLNPKYIDIAYAEYLDFETYSTLVKGERASYDAARSLYQKYLPDGFSSFGEPAPVNEYVRQGAGFS
jgi:hypothetical protein